MSRIKIQLPEQFSFFASIPIRITDLNYGGHVGNDTVLSLLHEARVQFLKSVGYAELEFEGVSLIMSDVGIEFKQELFYGDVVKAFVAVNNFTKVSFDVYYKLVREADQKIVTIAKSAMVCYNYDSRKIVAIPEKAKEKLLMY